MLLRAIQPLSQIFVVVDADEFVAETMTVSKIEDVAAQSRLYLLQEFSVRHARMYANGNQVISDAIEYLDLDEGCLGITSGHWRGVHISGV